MFLTFTYFFSLSLIAQPAIISIMKKDQTLSFKVTDDLKRKLEAKAKGENRSLSNLVQLILAKEVEKDKKR
ncbi:MAG: hypothetical protein A2036_03525 [Omnitrophica bacterium GWA2_50_21]|nr:MAG: hypothetical protein A2036_03525 [Omnitrophica bacterium GWA2_50_21]